jgi:hypothetical protein
MSGEANEQTLTHRPEAIPDELLTETLDIRCTSPELVPDACDGWETSVEIDPANICLDERDWIYFPDHVPTVCPDCHSGLIAYNGVELNFDLGRV